MIAESKQGVFAFVLRVPIRSMVKAGVQTPLSKLRTLGHQVCSQRLLVCRFIEKCFLGLRW
jgi:hypothetical protein